MAIAILLIFVLGYLSIALEHTIRINKAATALITGVLCWTLYIVFAQDKEAVSESLAHHLGELSQILFFLLGAMTIVELIDAHDGFELITQRIHTVSKRKLTWTLAVITFFMSAVLDNLTTAIVMVSLVKKLVTKPNDRLMLAGLIVIAANAGGAWSPIGDVTTTMLWIGGQITAGNIIVKLILPSLVCLLVPLLFMQLVFRGQVRRPSETAGGIVARPVPREGKIIFIAGVLILLMVPVFKTVTHLPPFMGILIGLGILWVLTEILHGEKDEAQRATYTVAHALRRIDTPSVLFFLGILLAVAALESTGQLALASAWLNETLGDLDLIAISIGLLSAIVDNVPLVAATQGMYSLEQYPTDHYFWEFLAYTTGTGGSVLIIGSAAGVAAMGIEKINFIWYLKRIAWLALLGYFAGALVYILQHRIFG
ncbi:MAG TPA: sodium:proton antiporter NhaD [Chitinophagaceae bacterium]|nr:sodium:proton antiporter NhaD [Chitinophagaceae bacterium]